MTAIDKIAALLEEGDMRSIGNVPAVMELVTANPKLFDKLLRCMVHKDPGVRMRACDAVEKISRKHPGPLQSNKEFLLNEVLGQTQPEVRWHLAQIIPRLELTEEETSKASQALFSFLDDSSKIVQANALQALVELAWEDDLLLQKVKASVRDLAETGSPAVKNKAGKLMKRIVRKGS